MSLTAENEKDIFENGNACLGCSFNEDLKDLTSVAFKGIQHVACMITSFFIHFKPQNSPYSAKWKTDSQHTRT